MKLLYPDPRRRRPRFEYPGSAGAGPRQWFIQHSLSRDLLNVFSGLEQGTQSPCLSGAYVLERETDNKQLIHIII